MSALYGRKYVHVHIPKCAGKWVRAALKATGNTFHHDLSDAHAPAPEINHPDWVAFCFIRHPAQWLASWWAYCGRNGWADEGPLPDSFNLSRSYDAMMWDTATADRTEGFEGWVEDLYANHPAFVSRFFAPYIASAHEIGQVEHLYDDFARIVAPCNLPPVNVGENRGKVSDYVYQIVADNEPLEAMGYTMNSIGNLDAGILAGVD